MRSPFEYYSLFTSIVYCFCNGDGRECQINGRRGAGRVGTGVILIIEGLGYSTVSRIRVALMSAWDTAWDTVRERGGYVV